MQSSACGTGHRVLLVALIVLFIEGMRNSHQQLLAIIQENDKTSSKFSTTTGCSQAKVRGYHKEYMSTSIASSFLLNCQTVPTSDSPVFVETKTKPMFHMSVHDPLNDAVSREISTNGCFECFHLEKMQQHLMKYKDQDPYFVDIGGNIGMWSLTALATHPQVETFTFEPNIENYQKICDSIHRMYQDDKEGKDGKEITNFSFPEIYDRFHLFSIAATVIPEKFTLVVPEGNKGGTQVNTVQDQSSDSKDTIHGYPIDMIHLPIVNEENKVRPVLLKIDVEGHELAALLGTLNYLYDANIVFAMMELRPGLLKQDVYAWTKIFHVFQYNHGLMPYRVDYDDEGNFLTMLDIHKMDEWTHFKHPRVLYFDVIWMKEEFVVEEKEKNDTTNDSN